MIANAVVPSGQRTTAQQVYQLAASGELPCIRVLGDALLEPEDVQAMLLLGRWSG